MRVPEEIADRETGLDDRRPVDFVAAAAGRTYAAGSARIEVGVGALPPVELDEPIGLVRNPVRSFAALVVRLGSVPRTSQGVIDLTRRRYMLFGLYAQLFAEGTSWGGGAGRPLSRVTRDRGVPAAALWLWDLLQMVTAARETGREQVRGVSCRVVSVDVDVSRLPSLWRATPAPSQAMVWTDDDGYVRRIEVHAERRMQFVELWDFGYPVEALDWTRLPPEHVPRAR